MGEKYKAQAIKRRLEKQHKRDSLQLGDIKFNNKSLVSCRGVSMGKIVWEYVCWVLAGRPKENGHG